MELPDTHSAEEPQARETPPPETPAPKTQAAKGLGLAQYTEPGLALLVSGAFAASFGFNYGVDNQVAYLLRSLCIVDKSILHADWYAYHTTHYHPAFEYLGALLIAVNRSGWAIALANMLSITACSFLFYRILRAFAGATLALSTFLLLISICFVTRTSSVAASYAFDHIFQPSTLGGIGLFGGVLYFVEGRYLASGICLAIGGLFHGNYLVLAYPAFGLAQLALGVQGLRQRLIDQFVPLLVVTLFLAPLMLRTASVRSSADSLEILLRIRSPHHYNPARFTGSFIPLAGWHMIGIGAGWSSFRTRPGQRLGAVLAGLLAVVWAGTIGTTLVYEPRVAQLFVWRLAPATEIISQMFACVAVARSLQNPAMLRRYPAAVLALVLGGTALLSIAYGTRNRTELPLLVIYALAAVALAFGLHVACAAGASRVPRLAHWPKLWRRFAEYAPLLLACAGLYWVAPDRLRSISDRSNLLGKQSGQAQALYAWMREKSPKDAIFLTPPDVEGMRFQSQRAIVVDWKSGPISPPEVLAWYTRLSDVLGRELRNSGDLSAYGALDPERLKLLVAKYHVSFVVVRRSNEARLGGLEAVYRNGSYSVLKVPVG